MKSYLIFCAKILGILTASGIIGYALYPAWWCVLLFAVLPVILYFSIYKGLQLVRNFRMNRRTAPETHQEAEGFSWVDLNQNGKLDIYEDPREPVERRVEDLLCQMTVEEKAGLMFSPQMDVVPADKIATRGGFHFGGDIVKQIYRNKINTFCCMGTLPPKAFAQWQNAVQRAARKNRLGIPVTLCSDPRHVYIKNTNPLTTQKDDGMTPFPTSLGMSAANDLSLMRQYGQIVAEELRSVGICFALHPCADTATEPRWPRVYETFGDDSEKNGHFAAAYIDGMQKRHLGRKSVACCVKHFPGGGPQKNGDDPHFAFGKDQLYPGNRFEAHLSAFWPAIESGVAAVMPYYGIPRGLPNVEEVGFNFNRQITEDLLRKQLGFEGIVHTDYSIIEGIKAFGLSCIPGRAWGIEQRNADERIIKALDAGVDQFGGENCSRRLASLVRRGRISEERLNCSCRKILRLKFELGLFDEPYVDPQQAELVCKSPSHAKIGDLAMWKSLVLLKKKALPLQKGVNLYAEGFSAELVRRYGKMVAAPEQADFALVRLDVPKHPDKRDPMAVMFESGSLEYTNRQKKHWNRLMETVPTIFVINLNRPAVISDLKERAAGILGEFNTKPEILLDAVFGVCSPGGILPYSLPKSMEILKNHAADTPLRPDECTYYRGFGLTYGGEQ